MRGKSAWCPRHSETSSSAGGELPGTQRVPPLVPGPVQPTLDDRKRQQASAFAWSRVTQGELRFAPQPIEAGQPEPVRKAWLYRRGATWFQLSRPDPLAHYAERTDAPHPARRAPRQGDRHPGRNHPVPTIGTRFQLACPGSPRPASAGTAANSSKNLLPLTAEGHTNPPRPARQARQPDPGPRTVRPASITLLHRQAGPAGQATGQHRKSLCGPASDVNTSSRCAARARIPRAAGARLYPARTGRWLPMPATDRPRA